MGRSTAARCSRRPRPASMTPGRSAARATLRGRHPRRHLAAPAGSGGRLRSGVRYLGSWRERLDAIAWPQSGRDGDGRSRRQRPRRPGDQLRSRHRRLAWMNHASWQFINPQSPSQMVTGDLDHNGHDEIIAVFAGAGVWRWSDGNWWHGSTRSIPLISPSVVSMTSTGPIGVRLPGQWSLHLRQQQQLEVPARPGRRGAADRRPRRQRA